MFERQTNRTRKVGMTPLIDMVFLLLVFFMLTTTFQRNQATQLDFGRASGVQVAGDKQAIITTARGDGTIGLGIIALKPHDFRAGLLDMLGTHGDNHHIIIQSTPHATVQDLVRLLDIVQATGSEHMTVVEGLVPGTETHRDY